MWILKLDATRNELLHRSLLLIAAAQMAIGCSSGGGDGGTGPTPSIALSLGSSSATVVQGGSSAAAATLTRGGGFTGNVVFTVEGVPAGVSGVVSNVVTTGNTTTATVTINVDLTTVPGTYNLTVRGKGTGVTDATAAFALTVTAAPAYTLALTPAAISIVQNSTDVVQVAIGRTNFSGAITLTLEGAPAGVTGVFAPPAPTGTAATLTITVGPAVTPGIYTLTVRGTAAASLRAGPSTQANLTDQTVQLVLTVVMTPGYVLSLVPAALSIAQGASTPTTTVDFARTNFTGSVALSLEGAPAGVTGAFAPTPTTGASSTLTLTVGALVLPGDYALTVRGTAAGLADRTAALSLTVTAAVRGNGKIAFADLSNGSLWVVNPDGSGLTQLTPGFGASPCVRGDAEPAWSPDGAKIAFSRWQNGSGEIWTMNADGTNQTRLTQTGDGSCSRSNPKATFNEAPSWSPDGTKLIFASDRSTSSTDKDLWIMNADGSGQTKFFGAAANWENRPRFSPDGRTIAFDLQAIAGPCGGVGMGPELWLINADGTNPRRLTTVSDCVGEDIEFSWSPDGQKIAFRHFPGPGCGDEIYVINSDGSNRTQLTNCIAGKGSKEPAFSPDGSKIVYRNGGFGNAKLWIMNANGTGPAMINTGSLSFGYGPAWQPIIP